MTTIFKLNLGLDVKPEDPDFEWTEYFSTEEKMNEYIKQYEKSGEVDCGEKNKDYDYEEIELDNPKEKFK